jgi:hypothetical protein
MPEGARWNRGSTDARTTRRAGRQAGFHSQRKGREMSTQCWTIRKRAAGRGITSTAEFQASLTVCRDKHQGRERYQVGLRLSRFLMRKVGWQPGDFVLITCYADGRWQLDRTSDQAEGFRLSRNGKSSEWSSCSVKFAPSPEQRDAMFATQLKSRACVVVEATPTTVVAMYE